MSYKERMEELLRHMVNNNEDFDDHTDELAKVSTDADNSLSNFMGNTVRTFEELLRRIEDIESRVV